MWRSFPANCFLLGAIGAGTGMIVSSSSALVVVLYPRKEGVILSFHHFCYALGAIFGPLVMGYVLKSAWDWRWVYRVGGISILVLGVIFLLTPREHEENKGAWNFGSFFYLLKEKNLIFLVLIILLGAGTQNGLYFWLVSFLKEIRSFPILLAGLGLSLFSVGLAIGRLFSVWASAWLGNTRLLSIFLITLNVAIFLLLHIAQNKLILALCFMAGMGCSGMAPIVLALGGINFPHLLGTTMGILSTAAGIGSTFMPWIMSMASQRASLKAGLFASQLAALVAFGLLMLFFKRLRDSEGIS
jgi:fucose permease